MKDREAKSCQAAELADRAALRVSGADAEKFLQGLLTNDLGKVNEACAIHAGLLSPQGKILFDVFVVRQNADSFLLEARKASLAALSKRLSFYRLRAAVEISETPPFRIVAAWGGAPNRPEGAVAFPDPRLSDLGMRVLLPEGVPMDALLCTGTTENAYHAHRIALGVPEGGRDYPLGDTFPHEALFDQLNGVDFEKGCFVGQEVVSRMEHRGTARKRVVPVDAQGPLQPGAEITAGEISIGAVGSVDGAHGLALLRLDRAKDAISKGTPLTAGDEILTLRQPAFASFDIAEAETS